MTNTTNPPERYASYHHPPEKTHSILERANVYAQTGGNFSFEYNGIGYRLICRASSGSGGSMHICGTVPHYVVPYWDGEEREIATFTDFTSFISTYAIEGRTLEWILEHQREWKYQCPAAHLESILNEHCLGFAFVYRKTPCYIAEWDRAPNGVDREYYMTLSFGKQYDVASYAPVTPGAEHWTHRFIQVTGNGSDITVGPYATIGELLDRILVGGKTLREIFDTEYDDGPILCGWFGV